MASDQDRDPATPGPRGGNPVLRTALVVYGTLLLLLLTMPGSVVSWLQGLNSNVLQQTALRAAEAVQSGSDRVGLSTPYLRARTVFLEQIRGE